MNIDKARQALFAKDETLGYIEREAAIDAYLALPYPVHQADNYVTALEYVLPRLSTPIEAGDILLGRMLEGPIPYDMEPVPGNGLSHVGNPFRPTGREAGHMSLDYARLLRHGLCGIAEDMQSRAETDTQRRYAALARRAAEAVRAFSERYAQAAAQAGLTRAAEALRIVPCRPAYDFFSAVQSVWMAELILSCVTGGRDFAYARLDVALLPYFDPDDTGGALEVLTAFFLKNNEIGGLNSDLYRLKPVPCTATNIYLMLGGRGAEAALPLSLLFLEAARAVSMPQPCLALRIAGDSPPAWKRACARAAQELSGQASAYNDDVLIPNLRGLGYSEEDALHYTMSGCNRADFPGHQSGDRFHNAAQALLDAFYDEGVHTMDDLLTAFYGAMQRDIAAYGGNVRADPETDLRFNLESLLIQGCMERVRDIENGAQPIETAVHHLCGIATVADSLYAIHRTVFEEGLLTLDAFRALVRGNYADGPGLHRLIRRYPKYGNDIDAADRWMDAAGDIMARAVRDLNAPGGLIHIPGIYSLFNHHSWGKKTGATPDGRLAGEPLSENQSPSYGADTEGATALLHSAAHLPHRLLGCGGLNLRLTRRHDDDLIAALIDAYFAMGGTNLCLNVVNADTLIAARADPEHYSTLCVRIVGFSEIFVRLPEHMQLELIARTGKAV